MEGGTVDWLKRNDVRHDLLVVRPADDRRSSPDYKRDELVEMGSAGYDVQLAIDDDEEIVDMLSRRSWMWAPWRSACAICRGSRAST